MSYGHQTRISFGPVMTPMVKILLGLNLGAYVLLTIDRTAHTYFMDQWLSLIPLAVTTGGEIWRLVTYLFLHGQSPLHIMLNMLILWMFGPEIERVLGRRQFIFYYLLTGVGAGLCSLAVTPFSPHSVMGASGAMYALLLAFALYFPNQYLLLFFFLPVKAKYLVAGTVVLELLFSLSGVQDGIAHVAHLGGMVFGYLWLKRRTLLPDLKYRWLRLRGWWYRRKFKVVRSRPEGNKRPWSIH